MEPQRTAPSLFSEIKLPYLSLCFTVLLPSSLFVHTSSSLAAYDLFATYGSNIIQGITFLGLAFGAPRLRRIRHRKSSLRVASIIATVGVAVTEIAAPTSNLLPLFASGVLLALVGSAVLYLSWLGAYVRLGTMRTLACYAGSLALAAFLQGVLAEAPPPAGAILLAFFPLLSAWGLLRTLDLSNNDTGEEQTTYEWRFPWRPIALFSVFTFAFKLSLNLLPESHKALAIAMGTFAAAAIVLALMAHFGRKTDLQLLYSISLPCAIAGLLFAIDASASYPEVGVMLVAISRELFTSFMVVVLCNMCFRNGIDAFWLFGLVFAFSRLASLAANAVATMATSGEIAISSTISVTTVIVACVFVVFTSDRNAESLWGIRKRTSHEDGNASLTDTDIAMHKLARSCNLTLREEEIALLRLQHLTVAEVASLLYIVPATVKTHMNRIYRKTETHSIEELIVLLGEYRK
ncbi:MAG: helix-turn-helix transcriptional regulator [Adlercreutzia sp.]|nr:helix-turn-helix transcriptional regulator [Adlercreutzia sp.]